MRIIAGQRRGLRLLAPPSLHTRPSSDRLREALFNILEAGGGGPDGTSFLDVFAGSGAVGIEALSRGAERVAFVENDAAALKAIRANLGRCHADAATRVIAADALRLGPAPQAFDTVFLDPPYGSGLVAPTLERLAGRGWLAPDARVVAEVGAGEAFAVADGFGILDERRYGAGRLVFLGPA